MKRPSFSSNLRHLTPLLLAFILAMVVWGAPPIRRALADAGGFPTSTPTPTFTPTFTPTLIIETPTDTPLPEITPTPTLDLTPIFDIAATPIPLFETPTPISLFETPTPTPPPPAPGAPFICWPFALIFILIVIIVSLWLFGHRNPPVGSP